MAFCQCTKDPPLRLVLGGNSSGRASLRGKHERVALTFSRAHPYSFFQPLRKIGYRCMAFCQCTKDPFFPTSHVFLASSLSGQKPIPDLRRDPAVLELRRFPQNIKKIVSQRKNERPLFVGEIYHHTSR